MDDLDDRYLADLVVRAQQGNSNAFAELYAATYQKQYRYSCRYLRDEHLAHDALQETYIQALKNLRTLQDPTLFVAWLNRINFRVCYDLQKKNERYVFDEGAMRELELRPGDLGRPEEEVVAEDVSEYILQQVRNLPLTESQAILMRYYQDLSIDEIAENLGVSRSTVKRSLKSGRERLKRRLADIR